MQPPGVVAAALDAPPLAQGGTSPRLAASADWAGPGIAARLSASLPTGGGAAALAAAFRSSAATDLEQPLLPGEEEAEQQYVEHVLEPKPWPTLRGSSVSTRRSECGGELRCSVLIANTPASEMKLLHPDALRACIAAFSQSLPPTTRQDASLNARWPT